MTIFLENQSTIWQSLLTSLLCTRLKHAFLAVSMSRAEPKAHPKAAMERFFLKTSYVSFKILFIVISPPSSGPSSEMASTSLHHRSLMQKRFSLCSSHSFIANQQPLTAQLFLLDVLYNCVTKSLICVLTNAICRLWIVAAASDLPLSFKNE